MQCERVEVKEVQDECRGRAVYNDVVLFVLGLRRASCRPPYGTAKCASE
jgi:hypothetical protein